MASASTSRQLEDILTCCLCFELYDIKAKVPKALPCQHTFCAPCLDRCLPAADEKSQLHRCPKCKASFVIPLRGAVDLPTNFSVQDMLQSNLHKGKPELNANDSKDSENKPLICEEHPNRQIMMVCMPCEVGLCTECMKSLTKSQHREHGLEDVHAYLADFQRDLGSLKTRCQEIPSLIDQVQQKCNQKIIDEERKWEKEIDDKAGHVIEQVKKWQKSQKENSKSASDSNRSYVVFSIDNMRTKNKTISEKISKIEELYSSGKLPCISHVVSVMTILDKLESKGEDIDRMFLLGPHTGSIDMVIIE